MSEEAPKPRKKRKRGGTAAEEQEEAAAEAPAPPPEAASPKGKDRKAAKAAESGPTSTAQQQQSPKKQKKKKQLEEDAVAVEEQQQKKRKPNKDVVAADDAAQQDDSKVMNTSKPSALDMFRPRGGRSYTVSVALPASIIDNCPGGELKAFLVGQLARAFTIFSVDEVVLWEDNSSAVTVPMEGAEDGLKVSNAMGFFVRNLQYLETPQYLRRALLPMHKDLKWVGLLSPLDAPHHLRRQDRLPYREGVVLSPEEAWYGPPVAADGTAESGCWANCGLAEPVWVSGQEIPTGLRVTLRLGRRMRPQGGSAPDADVQNEAKGESGSSESYLTATAVSPAEPTTRKGLYWGFQVRIAKSMRAVFEECPHEGGYDLKVGTSERGEKLHNQRLRKFNHLLIMFGGVGGLEDALQDEGSEYKAGTRAESLFDMYLNVVPNQTSRTVRTEEAVMITLATLSTRYSRR